MNDTATTLIACMVCTTLGLWGGIFYASEDAKETAAKRYAGLVQVHHTDSGDFILAGGSIYTVSKLEAEMETRFLSPKEPQKKVVK